MHYYSFNIGDYSSSTQHLEPMEDLAYRRMLDLYYSKESPLPKEIEKIARLIRMRSHTDSIAIVLEEFFTKEKDGYHNKGADKALGKVYKKSEAARKSAEARWNKNKDLEPCERNANASKPHCDEDANGMLPNTQYPIPNTHTKDTVQGKPELDSVSKGFDLFWQYAIHTERPVKTNGLKRVNKAQALKSFKAQFKKMEDGFEYNNGDFTFVGAEAFAYMLIDDVGKRCDTNQYGFENSLHPTTYLNNQRWNDDYETNQPRNATTGRKLSAVEENNARLLAKYGNSTAPSERTINPAEHTGMDSYQVSGSVQQQVATHGITIDMDAGDLSDDSEGDPQFRF